MVTQRSDSQFAGMVNSWTGRSVRGFVKSRNAVFLNRIYINYLTPIFHYIVSEYFPFLNFGWRAVEFAECCKRQQIRPNRAWTALSCSIYCCLVLFRFQFFLILPFSFSEVETASEMTKTMLEWVFYLLTWVNIAFVN